MHQISRKGTKLGGTFPIYDGREDAIAHGIPVERIKHWKDYAIAIGDYAEYPDGCIAEVIRVYGSKRIGEARWHKAKYVTTRLNCYSQSQSTVTSKCLPYSSSTTFLKPETISNNRTKFAEAWLLQSMEIGKACRKHLWQTRMGNGSDFTFRTYAYITLSLPWFDKLLKSNRLIRDRYMSLVGALDSQGVNETFVAEHIKKDILSDNAKLHINALNKAIETLEVAAQKKKIPIEASLKVMEPERISGASPAQLSSPATVESILKESINEESLRRSAISETKGDTPIFPITSNEEQSRGVSETHRVEAVPAQAAN
jgi:hypothetical protein